MNYLKNPLSFPDQIKLIQSRGAKNIKSDHTDKISNINYYKFTAYLKNFEISKDHFAIPLDEVFSLYEFDQQLRREIFNLIEIFEVSFKTQVVNYLTLLYNSPFAHLNRKNYTEFENFKYIKSTIEKIELRAYKNDKYAHDFFKNYSNESNLPFWIISEALNFSEFINLFQSLTRQLRTNIATIYGINSGVLNNWLVTYKIMRNICAHNNVLWNYYSFQKRTNYQNRRYKSIAIAYKKTAVQQDAQIWNTILSLKYLFSQTNYTHDFTALYKFMKDTINKYNYYLKIMNLNCLDDLDELLL